MLCVSPVQGERRPKRRRKQLHDLSGVGSVGIVARGPLDEYRFNMFMRDLLAEKAKDIFRCKGVLAVHVSIKTLLSWSLVGTGALRPCGVCALDPALRRDSCLCEEAVRAHTGVMR